MAERRRLFGDDAVLQQVLIDSERSMVINNVPVKIDRPCAVVDGGCVMRPQKVRGDGGTRAGWSSGEAELKKAQRARRWADGQPLGRGHGVPYLQEKYALNIRAKLKTVEGRPGDGWAACVKPNDWITFKIPQTGGRKLICRATRVRRFDTFQAMLLECGVQACLPGLKGGVEAGVDIYHSFGTFKGKTYAEIEAEFGAIAIDVEPLRPA